MQRLHLAKCAKTLGRESCFSGKEEALQEVALSREGKKIAPRPRVLPVKPGGESEKELNYCYFYVVDVVFSNLKNARMRAQTGTRASNVYMNTYLHVCP